MIPKTLHIIWVGDESKRPDNCIDTWRVHNPDWELKIWGNAELMSYGWYNADHIRAMSGRELNGVADIMRWEILFREGGFVVDADSICRRPLEPWLFDCEACACWENEIIRPGLIAAGYVASEAQNPFFRQLILDLKEKPTVIDRMAWQSVGPLYLTEAHRKYNYINLTVWPSHFFIPQHYSGIRYSGKGPVFADQEWGSTRRNYDELHTRSVA